MQFFPALVVLLVVHAVQREGCHYELRKIKDRLADKAKLKWGFLMEDVIRNDKMK